MLTWVDAVIFGVGYLVMGILLVVGLRRDRKIKEWENSPENLEFDRRMKEFKKL